MTQEQFHSFIKLVRTFMTSINENNSRSYSAQTNALRIKISVKLKEFVYDVEFYNWQALFIQSVINTLATRHVFEQSKYDSTWETYKQAENTLNDAIIYLEQNFPAVFAPMSTQTSLL